MLQCKYLVRNPEGFEEFKKFVNERCSDEDKFTDEDAPETYPCIFVVMYTYDNKFDGYDTVELENFATKSENTNNKDFLCI